MIEVLLADDHGVLRDGVRRLLEATGDIRVAAVVSDGRHAVAESARVKPDVVVMDVSMPGLDGIEATRAIVAQAPMVRVLILSMYSDRDVVLRALEAGARGYLLKETAGGEVAIAVRALAAGRRYLGKGVATGSFRDFPHPRSHGSRLTATEREIVRLVAEGRTSAEAADFLGLSPRTVETYRNRLMQKLAIGDFSSLVKYAIRSGITRLE
jgi:DNA-binding NarL/FixJ family response regulator